MKHTRNGRPTCRRGVPLAAETSFQIGGVAEEFYNPETLSEFSAVLCELRGREPFLLGGGCNTLFPDGRFTRPVVSTTRLRGLEIRGDTVIAETGVRLDALVRCAIEAGLSGLEHLVGIPGTVGGAVAMNAGGAGWCFGERVRELGLIPIEGGAVVRVAGNAIPWSYRSWNLEGFAVGWVALELSPGRVSDLRRTAREFFLRKKRTQPLGTPSAGCVFKNPPGFSAGRLIDEAGLKGVRYGGAVVSEQHANFIVNPTGRAKAQDVLALLEEVRRRVEASSGIRLETEIVVAGP